MVVEGDAEHHQVEVRYLELVSSRYHAVSARFAHLRTDGADRRATEYRSSSLD